MEPLHMMVSVLCIPIVALGSMVGILVLLSNVIEIDRRRELLCTVGMSLPVLPFIIEATTIYCSAMSPRSISTFDVLKEQGMTWIAPIVLAFVTLTVVFCTSMSIDAKKGWTRFLIDAELLLVPILGAVYLVTHG